MPQALLHHFGVFPDGQQLCRVAVPYVVKADHRQAAALDRLLGVMLEIAGQDGTQMLLLPSQLCSRF